MFGNGRFIPAHQRLTVNCKNCNSPMDWARREDNPDAIAFPPQMVCTSQKCTKSKNNRHKSDKLVM